MGSLVSPSRLAAEIYMAPRTPFFAALFIVVAASVSRAADPKPSVGAAPIKKGDFALTRSKEVKPKRLVVYKTIDDRKLELHVFEPAGHKPSDRRPCFLAIHGGGWVAGTPTIMYCVCEDLARRGWVCASMRYRLHKPTEGTTAWESVKDARSAMRYLRTHAGELGVDPNRIVAGGRSAGGHLAAMTALGAGLDEATDDLKVSCVPDALVLFSPVIDTSAEGYGHELLASRWKELSPRHLVKPGLPPTIVLHGMRDTTTPFAGAKAFDEAMHAAGNQAQLIAHQRGSHSYAMRTQELFDEAMGQALAFLKSAGIESPNK